MMGGIWKVHLHQHQFHGSASHSCNAPRPLLVSETMNSSEGSHRTTEYERLFPKTFSDLPHLQPACLSAERLPDTDFYLTSVPCFAQQLG